jgi:hypothetical protein
MGDAVQKASNAPAVETLQLAPAFFSPHHFSQFLTPTSYMLKSVEQKFSLDSLRMHRLMLSVHMPPRSALRIFIPPLTLKPNLPLLPGSRFKLVLGHLKYFTLPKSFRKGHHALIWGDSSSPQAVSLFAATLALRRSM